MGRIIVQTARNDSVLQGEDAAVSHESDRVAVRLLGGFGFFSLGEGVGRSTPQDFLAGIFLGGKLAAEEAGDIPDHVRDPDFHVVDFGRGERPCELMRVQSVQSLDDQGNVADERGSIVAQDLIESDQKRPRALGLGFSEVSRDSDGDCELCSLGVERQLGYELLLSVRNFSVWEGEV